MARTELPLEPRQVTGKRVRHLRRAGLLPANIYGHGLESVAVQADLHTFLSTLKAIGVNEVIDLRVRGERAARPAVVHGVQRHPITDQILHADFYQVSLREKMRADVPLVLTGASEGVSVYHGVLLQALDTLHVEALPLDIPAHIEVDVSSLKEIDSSIHVRDLSIPEKVTVLTDCDVLVARVAGQRAAEVEEEPEEAVAEAEAPAAAEEAAPGGSPAESES
jgi:large subunit ribosomal protein L25